MTPAAARLGALGLALCASVVAADDEPPPVTLSADRVELRLLLRTLADLAGLDLVLADAVGGRVTLQLHALPWPQALDAVLRNQGLAARRSGRLLWVAPRQQLIDSDKAEAEARLQQEQGAPLQTQGWHLHYAAASQAAAWLQGSGRWLSARGGVVADTRTNQLFVVDTEQRLRALQPLLQAIDTPVRQVLIEARLVEASRQFGRSLGVRVGRPLGTASAPARGIDLPAASPPGLGGLPPATLALTLFGAAERAGIEVELSALEAQGQGRIIASPRLLTDELQQAVIEQGSEIPYQHAAASGVTAVRFVKAVLGLRVTPRLTPDGQVQMRVEIHKDSVGPDTAAGPAIRTSTLQTQVRVEDGGTVVLGGIAASDASDHSAGVPGLSRLPVLGALFRTRSRATSSTELLVFLTPRIVPAPPVR